MRSPCLSCDLKDSSKDNPVCKDCDARCEYVRFINGATSTIYINSTSKRASVTKLKKAELYIQETCVKHFIELDDLKSSRSSGGIGDIKREVVHALYHEHKLTQKEIAYIFGKSANAIWAILQKKSTKTTDEAQASTEEIIIPLTRNSSGDLGIENVPKPDLSSLSKEDTPPSDKKVIYFSFKDYPDLHDYLIKTAKANFRKPEDHILYLINEEKQGIAEYEEVLQEDKKEP